MGVTEAKFDPNIDIGEMDPIKEIEVELETDGIEVERGDIDVIGGFLTYKGAHAVLYIKDSNRTSEQLLDDSVTASKPKFHTTWCNTLEHMEENGRVARYILSRRKNNKCRVTAREREPSEIARYDEYHEMEDVTLYVCKNCLKKINYKKYAELNSQASKNAAVSDFSIKEYLELNEGVLAPMRFYRAEYTDNNAPKLAYADDWSETSRSYRENANWTCSKCQIDMTRKKAGLHVHHIDGAKWNNRHSNLRVL